METFTNQRNKAYKKERQTGFCSGAGPLQSGAVLSNVSLVGMVAMQSLRSLT